MTVYCFTYNGGYGGGCAIVVANSPAEAFGILVDKYEFTTYYTDLKHCEELEDLKPNEGVEPKIICENFYSE